MAENKTKVSVIIPIYKAEKYIERCVHSLMNQTLEDLELIFVDDASPDNSMQLVRQAVSSYSGAVKYLSLIHI